MVDRVYLKPKDGKWVVQSGKKEVSSHRKKKRALKKAKQKARANKPCRLYIQGKDGKFLEELNYGTRKKSRFK